MKNGRASFIRRLALRNVGMAVAVSLAALSSALFLPPVGPAHAQTEGAPARKPEAAPELDDPNTRAAARELGKEAIALYKQGKYAEALDRITRAHELVKLTTTGLWRARCLQKLGRLVEASEQLREVTETDLGKDPQAVHVKAKADAQRQYQALGARIPKLTVKVEGVVPEDTVVTIDGRELPDERIGVPLPLDPGEHRVSVSGAGLSADKRVTLREGEKLVVPLRLEERDPARAGGGGGGVDSGFSPAGIVGFVLIGVGTAGLVVGSVFGGLALGSRSDLDANCPNGACLPEYHADIDTFGKQRVISTVSFIAGGVLASAGLVLVITDVVITGGGDESGLRVEVGPHGIAGAF